MFTCVHYSFPIFDWLCFTEANACVTKRVHFKLFKFEFSFCVQYLYLSVCVLSAFFLKYPVYDSRVFGIENMFNLEFCENL